MRSYHQIDLASKTVTTDELHGEDIVRAGRYLIAKTLVEQNIATVDPLSDKNPLIFSAGPFAGQVIACRCSRGGQRHAPGRHGQPR